MFNALSVLPTALATQVTALSVGTPSAAITEEMLQPLIDGVTANVAVILPVGLSLFAIFLGIALIPKLIAKFTN
jgi:hypothetical protein